MADQWDDAAAQFQKSLDNQGPITPHDAKPRQDEDWKVWQHDNQPGNVSDPTFGGFAGNVVKSGANLIGGMYQAARHPIDTAANLAKTVAGASPVSGPPGSWQHDVAAPQAAAVGDFYKKRYGGLSNIAHTAYEDPLGLAADLSTVAGGAEGLLRGGAAVADAANAGRVANAARTAADVAGNVSTYANPVAAAGKGISALAGKAMNFSSGLSPIEQAAVDYALQDPKLQGSVDAATATGNQFLGSAKAIIRKSPMSAGIAGKAENAQKAAIAEKMGDVAGAIPGSSTKLGAGISAEDKIGRTLTGYASQARAAYQKLFQIAKDNPENIQVGEEPAIEGAPVMGKNYHPAIFDEGPPHLAPDVPTRPVMKDVAGPVSTANIKAAARPILDEIGRTIGEAQAQASPSVGLLKQILARTGAVDLETAINDTSAIQNLARTETPALRSQAQRIAATLVSPYREAIDAAAAKLGPEAAQALEDGRAATISKYELGKAVPKQLKGKPVNIINYVTAGDDSALPVLSVIQKHTPEAIPDIARSTIESIFGHTTAKGSVSRVDGALNKWNKLGEKTKSILFGADTSQEITDLLQYARMATDNLNPSGSATVGSVAGLAALLVRDPMHAIAAMAGSRAMARRLFDPEVAATMRRTGQAPMPQPGRIGRAVGAYVNPKVLNAGRVINQGTPNQP